MTPSTQAIDTDVAIVGAGPVGTLLAILLGQRGKRVTLIERWSTHYDLPRAVTFDHEIARILATLGIDAESDLSINHHDELYYWRNARARTCRSWIGRAGRPAAGACATGSTSRCWKSAC